MANQSKNDPFKRDIEKALNPPPPPPNTSTKKGEVYVPPKSQSSTKGGGYKSGGSSSGGSSSGGSSSGGSSNPPITAPKVDPFKAQATAVLNPKPTAQTSQFTTYPKSTATSSPTAQTSFKQSDTFQTQAYKQLNPNNTGIAGKSTGYTSTLQKVDLSKAKVKGSVPVAEFLENNKIGKATALYFSEKNPLAGERYYTDPITGQNLERTATTILTPNLGATGKALQFINKMSISNVFPNLIKSKGGQVVTSLVDLSVKGAIVSKTTELGLETFSGSKEGKKLLKESGIETEIGNAYTIETAESFKDNFGSGVMTSISPLISPKKDVFYSYLTEKLQAKGYSESDINKIIGQEEISRRNRAIAEIVGFAYISKGSERLGRIFTAEAFAKAEATNIPIKESFKPLFNIASNPIGRAGLGEGFSTGIIQDLQRGQANIDIPRIKELTYKDTTYTTLDLGTPSNAVLGGGLGFVIAKYLGGSIVATQLSRPKLSRTLKLGGYLTDPYELVGDKLDDISSGFEKKYLGRTIPQATFRQTTPDFIGLSGGTTKITVPTFTFTMNPSTTSTVYTPSKPKGRAKTPTYSYIPTTIDINPFADTNINGKTESKTQNPPVPVPINIPSNVYTETVTNIFNTDTATPTETTINTITNTNTNIFTSTNVATLTPLFRVPPPIPFALGSDIGSGAGSSAGRGKRYINEVTVAMGLINSGGAISSLKRKPKLTKKERKAIRKANSTKKNTYRVDKEISLIRRNLIGV